MLDNGEDIVTVKDAMGHASIMTTQRYDRRGDDRLRKAARHLRFLAFYIVKIYPIQSMILGI